MDVRVFDLHNLEKELALIVDVHGWLQGRAVVDNLMCDRVQQARRRLRLQSSNQQFRQTPLVEANRVRERSLFTLDKLNYPSVVRDGVPQTVQVLVGRAMRVVALPAHARTFL